ncbi:MAG: NAD(P) transhydrogenase subunit alpha [Pseudomonadota bacterium]
MADGTQNSDAVGSAAETAAEKAQAAAEAFSQLQQQAEGLGYAISASTGVDPFVFRLAIFVLAIFVGYYVVWSVTPALHTPLMAVTNAVSSVIIVGALVALGGGTEGTAADGGGIWASKIFGFLGAMLAAVNIFGGFLVTSRMLAMYKKKS